MQELITIAQSDGFLSLQPGGKFDEQNRHIRTREIGEILNANGGIEQMRKAAGIVAACLPAGEGRKLEVCWGYIGSWLP